MVFKNIIKDYFKKNSDTPFSNIQSSDDSNNFEDSLEADDTLQDLLESDFAYEQILQAMQALSETDKEIIFLRFIEEKNTNDIAEICGVPDSTIRKRLSRAIQNLKSLLITDIS